MSTQPDSINPFFGRAIALRAIARSATWHDVIRGIGASSAQWDNVVPARVALTPAISTRPHRQVGNLQDICVWVNGYSVFVGCVDEVPRPHAVFTPQMETRTPMLVDPEHRGTQQTMALAACLTFSGSWELCPKFDSFFVAGSEAVAINRAAKSLPLSFTRPAIGAVGFRSVSFLASWAFHKESIQE
jgi:hypothetical protein